MEDADLVKHIANLTNELREAKQELYKRKINKKAKAYVVELGKSVIRVERGSKTQDFFVVSMEEHLTKFDDNIGTLLVLRKILAKGGVHGNLQYLFQDPKSVKVVGTYKLGTKGELNYDS